MVSSTAPSFDIPKTAYNQSPSVGASLDEQKATPKLFTPVTSKNVTIHNRIVIPPMCMYSAVDGFANDFHLAHYGSLAIRGPGMIIIEATAVEARGRISPQDLGLWSDEHIAPLKRVVDFIKSQGVVSSIQLAHAGRKASMGAPFIQGNTHLLTVEKGGWPNNVVGASDVPFDVTFASPKSLSIEEIKEVIQSWVDAAIRADKAGIEVLEIHSAHGYLLGNFLSGNSNKRTDQYGGSFENRIRFPIELIQAVRNVWPQEKPLWVRFSATDYKVSEPLGQDENGWDIHQSVEYAKALKAIGVDVIDVSSGGNLPGVTYPVGPHYQVPFAEIIKEKAGIPTGAVGIINEPKDAEAILQAGKADYILVGREHLRNPAWTARAAQELGVNIRWPGQYARANRERF